MKTQEGFEKLNEHYKGCLDPGLILGDAEAIVGPYGLTVCINLPVKTPSATAIANSTEALGFKYEEHRKIFVDNDHLPIIKFTPTGLIINVGWLEPAFLSYAHFKGFRFHNKIFVNARKTT